MNHKKRGTASAVEEVALKRLGVKSKEEINDWFRKSYAGLYTINGIDKAIEIIDSQKWDRIDIEGDYDIDGATAVSQGELVLSELGYPVHYDVPRRHTEGFGLNIRMIQDIPDGNNLIITVDNGIAAIEAVALAKKRGFTVIVTDHHEPVIEDGKIILPDADLIIDPHVTGADYTEYCGSGIMYKLLCHLLDKKMTEPISETSYKKIQAIKAIILPLAMMGTIGDVVELREENYVIAKNGLKKLEKRVATAGMIALHDKLWITNPTASDIGFKSGPCINANGRLHDNGAMKSVELLACMDYRKAATLVDMAIANNNLRKQQVEAGMKQAEQIIEDNHMQEDLPMVVYLPGINEGIIGILAGKLREKYGTVALVFTDSHTPGLLKGSGRSIDDVDLKGFLDELQKYFVTYGGHKGAAGLTLKEEQLCKMRKASMELASQKGYQKEVIDTLYYDLVIRAEDIPTALEQQMPFAPFGNGNEPIVYKITGFTLLPGKDGKLKGRVGENGSKLNSQWAQAIGFGLADRVEITQSTTFTLYGTLSYNYFKGEQIPQVEFVDFEEEAPGKAVTPLMAALLKKAKK